MQGLPQAAVFGISAGLNGQRIVYKQVISYQVIHLLDLIQYL